MTIDRDTVSFYDNTAEDYAEFSVEQAEHPKLTAFLAALPEGARVLDLGCGIGWAAAEIGAEGHRVEAWDASSGLAAVAKARYGVDVRIADFVTLSLRQRFDAIWCHFALQHASRGERPAIFERLHTALRPGGLLYVGVQKGPMDWRDDLGRLYCPFTEDDMRDLLEQAGFSEIDLQFGTGRNYDGTPTLGLYAWARA